MRFVLKQIRLNQGGYDSRGRYWGVGAPLYHYEDWETGDISGELRAYSRADAKAKLKAKYPEARTKNPVSSTEDWIPCHAIRPLPGGGYQVLKEKNPGKVNFGFKDVKGVFHSLAGGAKRAVRKVVRRRKNSGIAMTAKQLFSNRKRRAVSRKRRSKKKS